MLVEVHTLCHQEAKLIPFVMRHYRDWATVYAYIDTNPMSNGYPTDGSVELLQKWGANCINLNTAGEANDGIFVHMKNNCWKGSKADWVIVTDFDELVYAKDILKKLEGKFYTTLIRPPLFNMYSDSFPNDDSVSHLTDLVKEGTRGPAKYNTFKPNEIKEMNFEVGCHGARPTGNVVVEDEHGTDVMTLHYRNFGKEYVFNRNDYTAKRLSALNKRMGWGLACTLSHDIIGKYLDEQRESKFKILE